MDGWIKMYRKMLQWEWYTDMTTKSLALHYLLKANNEQIKWQGIDIGVGEFVTSVARLSQETGLSISQIRTANQHLEKSHFSTSRSTNRFTVVSVCNYGEYQSSKTTYRQANRQTDDKRMTTNKNKENKKNKDYNNKNSLSLSLPRVASGDISREERERILEILFFRNILNPTQETEKFIDYYSAIGWVRNSGRRIIDKVSAAKSWTPKGDDRRGSFNPTFLAGWQSVHQEVKKRDADFAHILITELKGAEISDAEIRICGTKKLYAEMDRTKDSYFSDLMATFFPNRRIQTKRLQPI